MLEIKNLSIYFDRFPAAEDVSFSLAEGRRTLIVGETGSGKSVLLLAILGLLPPSARVEGEILLDGQNLLGRSRRQMDAVRGSKLAYVPQGSGNGLNPLYSVGRQIDEVFRFRSRLSRRAARSRTVGLLRGFGIENAEQRAREYPFSYSGGMRQRALIAMGLASGAGLVLADEPTKGLDAGRIHLVTEAFSRLDGRTLLCVTHDLRLARALADQVIVMYAAQVVETAAGTDFFEGPLHPYAQAMLRALPENGLKAEVGFAPPKAEAEAQAGCRFYARCLKRCERCHTPPPLADVCGRKVRCWIYVD